MAEYTCNPSTQDAEAGGLRIQGQSGPHSKFQASLGYIVRPCLKKQNETKEYSYR
jgi:hypothetical protein